MATTEQSALMRYKDKSGNSHLIYPINRVQDVDGLEEALANIELTPGPAGKDGAAGADGVSATHSWNGTTLTVTSASGTSSANLKGDTGDKGDTGATGPKGDPGSFPIVAGTSSDGVTYTATLDGITALTVGLTIILVPNMTSTSTVSKLNLNGLGAKNMRLSLAAATSSTTAPINANFFSSGKPVLLTYNGTFWVTSIIRPYASDLYGAVPIANGGTGATDAATARSNLGITPANIGAAEASHTHNYAAVSHDHSADNITSGTLPVARGGTGATTFTSGYALIGNGTSAVTTRAITNNTAVSTAVTASTNLTTMNTLRYAINRTTSVGYADTSYTTFMARGSSLNSSNTKPTYNGQIAWTYG